MMVPPVTYESKGAGPEAIVLLHGIGGDARSFASQLDALSPLRRAIAWNMPGFADSPPVASLSFADLAGALDFQTVEKVRERTREIGEAERGDRRRIRETRHVPGDRAAQQ